MLNTLILCSVLFQDPQVRVENLIHAISYGSVIQQIGDYIPQDNIQNQSRIYSNLLGTQGMYGYDSLQIDVEPTPMPESDRVEFRYIFQPTPDTTLQSVVNTFINGKAEVKFDNLQNTVNVLSIYYFRSPLSTGSNGTFTIDLDNDGAVDIDLSHMTGVVTMEVPMPPGNYDFTVFLDNNLTSQNSDFHFEYLKLSNNPGTCVIQDIAPAYNEASVYWERDNFWQTRFYPATTQPIILAVGFVPGNPMFLEVLNPTTHLIVDSLQLCMFGTFYVQGFAFDSLGNLVTGNILKVN